VTSEASHVGDVVRSPGGDHAGNQIVTGDERDAALSHVELQATVPCGVKADPIDSREEIDAVQREARSTPSGSVGSINLDDLINVNSIDYIFVVN
jgi:hypothetical protein